MAKNNNNKNDVVKADVKKVSNKLVKHNVNPVVTPILRNHNKTILGCVHVVVCNLLGLNPLTVVNLIPYATITGVYTAVASNAKKGDKIDITKQTSFDGKNLNYVIAKDANNCLNGTASSSTQSKFKTSLVKLNSDTSVIADYFTYFCDTQKIDKKMAITKSRKSDYLKSNNYSDVIRTALGNVKTA